MSSGSLDPKKRRTYWLAGQVTAQNRDRALLLNQKGYDVRFFTSLDGLIAELETQRAGVIVVSDDAEPEYVERSILTLMAMPEIQGARLMLTVTRTGDAGERLRYLAACGSFRDVIPMNMDDHQWVQRFIFATAGRPLPYTQPSGQITLNNISAVSLPARVTAIDSQRLRIESRVRPAPGAILTLGGKIAEAMGVSSLIIKVESTQRSRLLYRFSDAIFATWSVPAAARPNAQLFVNNLKASGSSQAPRCRIFVAAQSPALRAALLTRFEDPRFEVSTALQKQSIVDEPRYFTPDIVFIEDQLCVEENGARFDKMMAVLSEQTTVLIFGRHDLVATLRQRHYGRRILTFHKIPKNLADTVMTRFAPPQASQVVGLADDACHISSDSPYSLGELTFPARLTRIHPHAAGVALPHMVGDFALCRIESPLLRRLLGRNPYIKFTATYAEGRADHGGFPHLAEGYLADLDQADRKALSQGLIQLMGEHLARFEGTAPASSKVDMASGRTPELGTAVPPARTVFIPAPPPGTSRSASQPSSAVASSATVGAAPSAPAVAVASLNNTSTANNMGIPLSPAAAGLVNLAQTPYSQANTAPVFDTNKTERQTRLERLDKIAVQADADPYHRLNISPATERTSDSMSTDVWQGVVAGLSSRSFRQFVSYTAIIAFVCSIFWALITVVGPHMEKSGEVYSDQLKKFAPHLNKPEK